jgi:LPXTG-motif cell wall-anchored protein
MTNGNVVRSLGIIPTSCPIGPNTNGRIVAIGTGNLPAGINGAPSNFTPAGSNTSTSTSGTLTLGNIIGGVLTGQIGGTVGGTINFTGGNYNGPAFYVNGTCVITGSVNNNIFTPTGLVQPTCPLGLNNGGSIVASGSGVLPASVTGATSNFGNAPINSGPLPRTGANPLWIALGVVLALGLAGFYWYTRRSKINSKNVSLTDSADKKDSNKNMDKK